MKATTIKIDGELLRDIERVKGAGQSVTSYVKSVLHDDLNRRKLREAAEAYRKFERDHPQERQWLAEWADADLVAPPKTSPKGRKPS